jgi:cell division protein FtsX
MKRNFLLTSTFFVTNLVYLFAILSWITIQSVTHLIDRWSQNSEMTVYLQQDASPKDLESIQNIFKAFSDQVVATYQSSESIRNNLKKLMPNSELDFLGNDELVAAIPPHFIVRASSAQVGDSLYALYQSITQELQKQTAVDSTSFGKSWAEKYAAILRSLRAGTLLFM